MVEFLVDPVDTTLVGKCEITKSALDQEVYPISHLQLGSISQVIKSVLKSGYVAFRRPTEGIGRSKVPDIITEAEKIWELKVSLSTLYSKQLTLLIVSHLGLFLRCMMQAVPNASLSKHANGDEFLQVGKVQVRYVSGYNAIDWGAAA
jgi:hypothetical protein